MPVALARRVMSAEYALLRMPLSMLENQVVVRWLDEESSLRLGFERTLGTLDTTVGRLVGDPELARRGATLSHRADLLEQAAVLEEKAEARRTTAEETLEQAEAQAAAKTAEIEREVAARLEAVESREQQQVARIAQRTQARTAKPKAQLKGATDLSQEAAKERAAAERLAELAAEEKRARRAASER
jgi:hypothetical protein